ncbi:LPD23 domain-containing protein [Pseudomonas sp. W22_MBD1_FP4]|uniref:ADP-ribosyltransferase-containing protein n=1 Tax=Pseudomonas sp. W22_MBD1_FP4 TaxID=3240272 RepID=UPI003F94DE2B
MPGLQHLFEKFAHSPMGDAQNGELVFQHPLTSMRLAIPASVNVDQLASYGWVITNDATAPTFNTLTALRRAFPALRSQHPDELTKVLDQHSVKVLLEAQPEEHRGRLARWLLSRSKSTGDVELAHWTKEACRDLPIKAGHPFAPSNGAATYLSSSAGVARITGNELDGYTLFQLSLTTGRTRTTVATTLDDLWFPNNEWGASEWEAYEQLLMSSACTAPVFAQKAPDSIVVAATVPQHLIAQSIGVSAYLGAAADDLRRKFRHAPTSQWLDVASAATGISQRTAEGTNLLIDLFMVEQLEDASVIDLIVPAMRAEDPTFASMTNIELLSVWRCAYDALLTSAPASKTNHSIKLRVDSAAPARRSTSESMRALLSDYYGKSAIDTLEASGKLNLVTHISELPPEMRDEILLSGAEVQPSAFYIEGQVFMIGDNIDPERVCTTFLHEVGEHAALHNMLGRDYGRIVSRFNKLLAEGDTYALQAAMLVPASTAPANLSSEHLAYLIQLTAQDSEAREGGHDGFSLGNRCLRDLRTWLYRTPLMRDLERQGELENFKLDPQDIAALAREAVDYYVAGTIVPSLDHNQWQSQLDTQLLDALHKASPEVRADTLNSLPESLQMAYLYSLASLNSPQAYETLAHMGEAVSNASTSADPITRALAGEITAFTIRLSNRGRAVDSLKATGLFASVSGTGNPDTSVLTVIRDVGEGAWQAEHYSRGLGLTLKEAFQSVEDAAHIIGHTHFPVHQSELDSVIAKWGEVLAAEHGQIDSLAFRRWHEGSVAKHSDGSPMVLYHGTASDFSVSKGMFWASTATPLDLRPTPAPRPAAPAPRVDQFANWFGDSKMVTDRGQPLEVYHGTNAQFSAFQISRFGAIGAGIYTSANIGEAQQYGDTVMVLHARITNPLVGTFAEVRAMQYPDETSEKFTERLIGLGYDGIATIDASGSFDYVVTFEPSQLKSASDNNGQYDRTNADIRFDASQVLLAPTETPAFKNWFGASKIVDGQGLPLVAYHGTGSDFTQFNQGPSYFTTRTDYSYIRNSSVVMPVYLSIQNPYLPADQSEIEQIRSNPERFEELKAQGFDGMIWAKPGNLQRGASGWGDDYPQFVSFYPSQIKSAIANVGTFERASADIRFEGKTTAPQIEQPAFKRWFGQSKLLDADGAPQVLYHGTNQDFSAFEESSINSRFPYSFGFHFTGSREEASVYADSVTNGAIGFNPASQFAKPPMDGGNVMPVYIRAENPLIITTEFVSASIEADINRKQIIESLEAARTAGAPYDSVIINRAAGDNLNVIVFDPRQIKSATGNAGSFDRDSRDLRFAVAPDTAASPSASGPAHPNQANALGSVEVAAPDLDKLLKGSVLADEYAEMRQDHSLYNHDDELDAEMALVMPVFLSAKRPFDADLFNANHKGSVRIGDFRDALVAQAESSGRQVNIPLIGSLVKTLRLAARNEESGPYYRTSDFWQENHFAFGQAGHAAIRQLFTECGFDSVKFTEQGHLTYGVFEPSQVKSAIGNVGLFTSSPDIRFSFAGVKALTSSPTRLEVAKRMAADTQPADTIWSQTGWMLGIDGEWRFEIDDSNARIRGFDFAKNEPEITTTDPANYIDWAEEGLNSSSGVPLDLVLDHPALYEAYPQMRSLKVKTFDRRPDEPHMGYFAHHARSFVRSKLFVATPWTLPAGTSLLSVMLHEAQHGIQQIEGFAPGAVAESFEAEVASSTPELRAQMQRYVEIDSSAAELACAPESYAEMSGHEPTVVERVKTWRAQGNWQGNVASFRRSLMTPYELYFHEAGEVEARNTQARMGMDAPERARVFPRETTDVDAALVRASRFISNAAGSSETEAVSFERADSALEWALKTSRWRDGLQDGAVLLQAGDTFNLFLVTDPAPANTQSGELYAVSLRGDVVGAFLFGPGNVMPLEIAAMVAPEYRRRGIASAAYDAVEIYTCKTPTPRSSGLPESASGFWRARETRQQMSSPPAPADTFAQWFSDSHTTRANGLPKTFFHGSMAAFSQFDAARHRSILNNQFQGDAFHFTESPEVASTYAVAARNQLFRQRDLLEVLKAIHPNPIGDLLMGFVEKGDAVWRDIDPAGFRQLQDLAMASGYDLNDVREVASYVEGSACAVAHDDYNLFSTHHNSDMPDEIKDIAQAMGLGDAVPAPVVMPVYLKCSNTLYTNDRHQARQAEAQGFDSVCYSGEDTIGGESEWMVFDAQNIRSAFEFNKDAQILNPQQSSPQRVTPQSPIAPPTDAGFDRWFEGSHCQNLFGEPRLVFAQASEGATFQIFGDVDTASVDAQGRITPAFLAIRSPFVVTNGATVTPTDLVEKVGERKAGMLIGDLARDGQLYIEDIITSARGSKWMEQAGFDGAIFRDRAGSNKYVVLGDGQSMAGTAVGRELSGPVVWQPVPKTVQRMFTGERVNGRQFMLTNQNKPHGHVVPMDSADQFLTASDRLYANWLNGQRITSTWIAEACNQTGTRTHLLNFLKQNRKALAGKSRIEDVFAMHMASLRENIADARREGREEGPQSNHHRVSEDKLSNALAWAIDNSSRCKSTRGLVASDLLHWNKSLSEQSELVRQALNTLGIDGLYQVEREGVPLLKTSNRYNAEQSAAEMPGATYRVLDAKSLTGRACYEELANDLGGSKWASEVLSSMGITGAQQTAGEVLLFKPEFNHRPQAAMTLNKGVRTAPSDRAIQLSDISGVIVSGNIGAACRSIEANQARALEVVASNIRLLSSREANRDLRIGSDVGNNEQTRSMLSDARSLKKELLFMITPRHFIAWKEPLTELQVNMLAPLIKLDHSHLLPGSAAFELLAGQHGIRRTVELLNSVGVTGAHAETETVCWAKGAVKVLEVVSNDTPRMAGETVRENAGLAKKSMSLG